MKYFCCFVAFHQFLHAFTEINIRYTQRIHIDPNHVHSWAHFTSDFAKKGNSLIGHSPHPSFSNIVKDSKHFWVRTCDKTLAQSGGRVGAPQMLITKLQESFWAWTAQLLGRGNSAANSRTMDPAPKIVVGEDGVLRRADRQSNPAAVWNFFLFLSVCVPTK